jgi:uncharacterized spore protein YtfJ
MALLAKNIIGEQIETEDKIIIPITKMGMGFSTGLCQMNHDKNREGSAGSIAGGGVRIFPVAVLIIFKGIAGPEGVKVVPLSQQSKEKGS